MIWKFNTWKFNNEIRMLILEVFKALIASWFDSSTRPYSLESRRNWMEDLIFCLFPDNICWPRILTQDLQRDSLTLLSGSEIFWIILVKISMQIGFSTVKRLARDLRHYRYYLDVLLIRQNDRFPVKFSATCELPISLRRHFFSSTFTHL